jgi:hypothetical protein
MEQANMSTPTKITHWNAKRSGASITVTGKDEAGAEVRIANVVRIDTVNVDGRTMVVASMDDTGGLSHVTLATDNYTVMVPATAAELRAQEEARREVAFIEEIDKISGPLADWCRFHLSQGMTLQQAKDDILRVGAIARS